MSAYSTMKISFFILLQLAGIYSTQKVSLENEITKHIDKWVTSIFTIGGKNGAETVSGIYGSELKEFEYNISNQESNFHTKCIFRNIVFQTRDSSDNKVIAQQIDWKFSESKISTFFEVLNFYIKALVKTGVGSNNEKSSTFNVYYATFNNFTSTAVRSYTGDNDLKTTHDFTCSGVDHSSSFYWYPERNPTAEEGNQIDRGILSMLPIALRKSLKDNQTSIQKLDDIFQKYEKPRQEIISIHPDFLSDPLKYYYLIPKTQFFCFILKRIVIHGLSNFESYNAHGTFSGIFTHTLLIRNLRGSMTLDYQSEKEKALKLNFQIDCFILSKKDDTDCVYARARYYSITRRKTNTSLSSRQSEVIMNRLQSVLATGLLGLPSKEIEQVCNVEMPLEKIKISNCSDWNTIKESYKGWIPFHDDE